VPGFSEIDLVSHSGNSAAGDFCPSLNLTDIHTGWTETQAVLGKGRQAVAEAHIEPKNATHVQRCWATCVTTAPREAIHFLYRNELSWFEKLFWPSVKLARQERGLGAVAALRSAANAAAASGGFGGRRSGEAGGAAAGARPPRPLSALSDHRGAAEEDLRAQPGGPLALDDACSRRARLGRHRGRGSARRSGRAPAASA
jgi:hypothetical protein